MSSKKKDPAPQPENTAPETPQPESAAPETPQPAEESPQSPSELDTAKAELAAEKEKHLRLLAEYDNYRKRSAREREHIYADVRADTLEKLLPVYDNLLLALAQETTDTAFRKGLEMTLTQFDEALSKLGVTPIEALGKTFDPALHNAVMHVEDDQYGEGEIVQEFRRGFRMGERIIRFSMVQVAN